jgi:predicted secreted protein
VRLIVLAGAFVILWFLALQILLPIGISPSRDSGVGDAGAPANPRMALKLALATVAATALWSIFYVLVLLRVINI